MKPGTGRCAILFPHGVLFRNEEAEMRRKLIAADVIDAVIGLGPNLFYNSPMEACIVVCRRSKPADREGKVLFIDAVDEVTRERTQSFLTDDHIARIAGAYGRFVDEEGFAKVATHAEVAANDGNLSIPLYVSRPNGDGATATVDEVVVAWRTSAYEVRAAANELFALLEAEVPS